MIKDIPNKIWKFFQSVVAELRLVEFPSRKKTLQLGNLVLLVSALFGLGLYLLDWLFQTLRNLLTTIQV